MTDTAIQVVIIDDHRLFNDGLYAMLATEPSIKVVAQIYDSRQAEPQVERLNPDIILADFNMPNINGIELTERLLAKNANRKIIILSMYNEERHIEAFRKTGAKGYLFKTATADEVIMAIKKVNCGEQFFPVNNSPDNHAEDIFLQKLKLSSREMDVIQLIKQGLKTKEIAEKLNISFYTAETHRKNIKLKIGLKGGAEFVKFVFES
jgi:DNA-binding NarL/FixJ family response regulator